MKKVIVTGGTGFVGRWLIKELVKRQFEITVIAIPGDPCIDVLPKDSKVSISYCDMSDFLEIPKIVGHKEYDLFFNLAWYGAGGPKRKDYSIQIANVKAVLDAYRAASDLGCKRFLAPGTIGEYMSEIAPDRKIVSDNLIYALSKRYASKMLEIIQPNNECRAIWCVLVNLYGPTDSTMNLVNYSIRELLAGNKPVFGPANQVYDFMHIHDCVRALVDVSMAENPRYHYLIGNGNPRQLKEFLIDIRDCINPLLPLGIGERPDDETTYRSEWFDNTALITDTNYIPHFSFKDGIMDTLSWLKTSRT